MLENWLQMRPYLSDEWKSNYVHHKICMKNGRENAKDGVGGAPFSLGTRRPPLHVSAASMYAG